MIEQDAEIQRLSILRKNHNDEQFVIRRWLRDLPDDIQRMQKRAEGLRKDLTTLRAHPDHAVMLGGKTLSGDEAVLALRDRLDGLPLSVSESRYIDLGTYRGLKFGIVLHPLSHPDIYLQGEAVRYADIRRDARGLALLNMLRRLADGYEGAGESIAQELALAESQFKDFKTRQGASFAHEPYLQELSTLREQLRIALSGVQGKEGESATDFAAQIKALRAGQVVEAVSERVGQRCAATAEEPVTTRLQRRQEALAAEKSASSASNNTALKSETCTFRDFLTVDPDPLTLNGTGLSAQEHSGQALRR